MDGSCAVSKNTSSARLKPSPFQNRFNFQNRLKMDPLLTPNDFVQNLRESVHLGQSSLAILPPRPLGDGSLRNETAFSLCVQGAIMANRPRSTRVTEKTVPEI